MNPKSALFRSREALGAEDAAAVAAVVEGAPADGQVETAPEAQDQGDVLETSPHLRSVPKLDEGAPPAEGDDAAPPAPPAALFQGLSKSFTKVEDLADYARELERKAIEQEARLSVHEAMRPTQPAPADSADHTGSPTEPAPTQVSDLEWNEDEFFADPKGSIAKLAKQLDERATAKAEKIVSQVLSAKSADQLFWDNFWTANADLKGQEALVELVGKKIAPEVKGLARDKVALRLANDVRAMVESIRGPQPARAAGGTVPTTRAVAPQISIPVESGPQSTVDQLKAMRAGRAAGGRN